MDPNLACLVADFEHGAIRQIRRLQTTFLDITCARSESPLLEASYRIHYCGKREFKLRRGRVTSLVLLTDHPLLVDYEEDYKEFYIASLVSDKPGFISKLRDAIAHKSEGWRTLEDYANEVPLMELLDKNYGFLASVPSSFAEGISNIAGESGITLSVLSKKKGFVQRGRPRSDPQVLVMDKYYVVADGFEAELLTK